MTAQRWFILMLASPILLGAAWIALATLYYYLAYEPDPLLVNIPHTTPYEMFLKRGAFPGADLVALTFAFAFIPYCIFLTSLAIWSRRKTVSQLRKTALLSPLLFAVCVIIYCFTLDIIVRDQGIKMHWFIPMLAPFTIVVGYLFVGAAYLITPKRYWRAAD